MLRVDVTGATRWATARLIWLLTGDALQPINLVVPGSLTLVAQMRCDVIKWDRSVLLTSTMPTDAVLGIYNAGKL